MTLEHIHNVALKVTRDADGKRQYEADGHCLGCGEAVGLPPVSAEPQKTISFRSFDDPTASLTPFARGLKPHGGSMDYVLEVATVTSSQYGRMNADGTWDVQESGG